MEACVKQLQQYGKVDEQKALRTMTTFRIGGAADYVLYPKDPIALQQALLYVQKVGLPYKVIGKGSNLLCSEQPYHGVIIRLDRSFIDFYYEGNELVAQAGCSIIALAYDAMKKGLSGLEFASGIPATVGGTLFMNAGAYKSSMKDIVKEVFVYRDGAFVWMPVDACEFGYRTSVFHQHPDWIILAARLQLTPKNSEEIRELMEDRKQRRMQTQPLEYPSAGSIFRNPEGSFAWKYIDELGLRGKIIGGAQISVKHSNFIINIDQATADDVQQLIDTVNNGMQQRYGFTMIMEVERFNW